MTNYEEKMEARRDYYRMQAEKAKAESERIGQQAEEMLNTIPIGQPVHGQKDRNYRNRIDDKFCKAYKAAEKSKYYEEKAESVGNVGISLDDKKAIDKLTDKLEKLKVKHYRCIAINAALRLKNTAEGNARLWGMDYDDEEIKKLRTPDEYGKVGYPAYILSSQNAEIHRLQDRIKELTNLKEIQSDSNIIETSLYKYKVDDNRCQFIFDGKPEPAVRAILKRHAFKWSP